MSIFRVSVPAARQVEPWEARLSITIHIVEDDEGARDSLAFLLSTAEYSVQAFASALDYLDTDRTPHPACIITDLRMPGPGGLEFIRLLRQRGNRSPVIVITGHGDAFLAEEALKAGAHDFIEKPFDHERLLSAVATVVSNQALHLR
jgi:two-component system response regulator FixJ